MMPMLFENSLKIIEVGIIDKPLFYDTGVLSSVFLILPILPLLEPYVRNSTVRNPGWPNSFERVWAI